jgi:acetyltransferase-like isoleucine patch superfamily enzyme
LKVRKVVRSIKPELVRWFDEMIRCIPGGAGYLLRVFRLRYQLASLGGDATFQTGVIVGGGKNISIGHRFSIMRNCSLWAYRGVLQIGDRVSVNSNVIIDACDDGFIGSSLSTVGKPIEI